MTLRPFIALFTVVVLSVAAGSTAVAQGGGNGSIKNIYVFGDSLSDNGNLFAFSGGLGPPSPPYFNGRFSNGPVWVEYLDDMLPRAELDDRAFGGSFSDMGNVNGPFPGVLEQVALFLDTGPSPKPRDLRIVWAGANNYIFEPLSTDPITIVGDVAAAVQQLAGAGCQNSMIPNLPNIGATPFGRSVPGLEDLLTQKIQAHNVALAEEVELLRGELGIRIILLDVGSVFDRTLAGQLGFVNSSFPCLAPLVEGGPLEPTGACPVEDDGQIASVAPGALFMDPVHPTTAAHKLIAAFAFGALAAAQGNQIAVAE